MLQFDGPRVDRSYTLDAMEVARTSDDYEENWEKFLTGFGKLDKRIDLMQQLKKQSKNCKNTKGRKIDHVFNSDEKAEEFYTTKHYYGGMKIQKITREFIAYMKSEGA